MSVIMHATRLLCVGRMPYHLITAIICCLVMGAQPTSLSPCGSLPCPVCPPPAKGVTTVTLVESLPVGNFSLAPAGGSRPTWEVLVCLIQGARHSLDVMAMYWNLLAPTHTDTRTWTPAQLASFGAGRGLAVYEAFVAAAERGVRLRLLSGVGISSDNPGEASDLARRFPKVVEARVWDATPWYDGGIMHQKMLVVDGGQAMYLGSANMDWLSLAQVKELGVLVVAGEDNTAGTASSRTAPIPEVGTQATALFRRWWSWASVEPVSGSTAVVPDPLVYVDRRVPCWSQLVLAKDRCSSPLDLAMQQQQHDPGNHHQQQQPQKRKARNLTANVDYIAASAVAAGQAAHSQNPASTLMLQGSASAPPFLSASPPEVISSLAGEASPRIGDQDALVMTILSATRTVSLSVMDWAPSSLYRAPAEAVWWPALSDALTVAATVKGVRVRLLVAHWAHTKVRQEPYLQALRATAAACHHADAPADRDPVCSGSLDVRLFEVPGWESTDGPDGVYPPFSRVNHVKCIVSDQRANIGTSNMAWGYCKRCPPQRPPPPGFLSRRVYSRPTRSTFNAAPIARMQAAGTLAPTPDNKIAIFAPQFGIRPAPATTQGQTTLWLPCRLCSTAIGTRRTAARCCDTTVSGAGGLVSP